MSEDVASSVHANAQLFRAQGVEGERRRGPTAGAARLLKEHHLLTLLLPERWSGGGMPLTEYGLVQIELAKCDMSLGWIVHVINANLLAVSTRPDALQTALLGDGPKVISGGVLPLGQAREVEGGYVVDGAWRHCAAVGLADWIFGGVRVVDKAGHVAPGLGFAFLPKADTTIEESWFVTGLQGAGANTAVAKGVHVPAARMVLPDTAGAGCERSFLTLTVRAGFLALLVGGVTAMHEMVVQRTKARPQTSQVVLYHLSKLEGQVEAATLGLFEVLGALDDLAGNDTSFAAGERARIDARIWAAVELVHEAVDACIFVAGSSALMNREPLSRYWRDMHMALRHIFSVPHVAYDDADGDGMRACLLA